MNIVNIGLVGYYHELVTYTLHDDLAHLVSNEVNGAGAARLNQQQQQCAGLYLLFGFLLSTFCLLCVFFYFARRELLHVIG